jgi:hypothetical protein
MLCFVGLAGFGGCKIVKAEILGAKSAFSVAYGLILECSFLGVTKLPRRWAHSGILGSLQRQRHAQSLQKIEFERVAKLRDTVKELRTEDFLFS